MILEAQEDALVPGDDAPGDQGGRYEYRLEDMEGEVVESAEERRNEALVSTVSRVTQITNSEFHCQSQLSSHQPTPLILH
jgi:hypothetical protein